MFEDFAPQRISAAVMARSGSELKKLINVQFKWSTVSMCSPFVNVKHGNEFRSAGLCYSGAAKFTKMIYADFSSKTPAAFNDTVGNLG